MERDIFIITVFCLVSEQMNILRKFYKIRHVRLALALSDEEVTTIEICGEFFKHSTDKDLFNYFKNRYQDWFPNWLHKQVEEVPDATLAELQERLEKTQKVRIRRATVSRELQILKLPRKKSRSLPPSVATASASGFGGG